LRCQARCVSDFGGTLEPLFARPRAEVAERTDRLLARPVRRHDGLHQHIVGVGLAFVSANRSADIHAHYESQLSFQRKDKMDIFSHYFQNFRKITTATPAISMRSPKRTACSRQNQ